MIKPTFKGCPICRFAFMAQRYNQKYCSRACGFLAHRTKTHKGYSSKYGQGVHRFLAEKALDRKLGRYEFVHHKDGNKENNLPSNLEIVVLGRHNSIHKTKYVGCKIEGCGNPHSAHGFCAKHAEKERRKQRKQAGAGLRKQSALNDTGY